MYVTMALSLLLCLAHVVLATSRLLSRPHHDVAFRRALDDETMAVVPIIEAANSTFAFKFTSAAEASTFTLYSNSTLESLEVPLACKASLGSEINCHGFVQRFRSPAWRGTPSDPSLLPLVCASSCASSLNSWVGAVRRDCRGYNVSAANPISPGATMLEGVRETCQVDQDGETYCNNVIDNFTLVESIDKMPLTELCSYCNVRRYQMMQATPYSIYDDMYRQNYLYIQSKCPNATGPTDVRLPEYEVPVPEEPLCISGKTISTTGASGTDNSCSAIAGTYGLSSAALYFANSQVRTGTDGRPLNCSLIPAGTELCLPYGCTKSAAFTSSDTCFGIEIANDAQIGDVAFYNPWVDAQSCSNLASSIKQLGNRVCLSPQTEGWTYTPPDNGTGGGGGDNNGGNGPSGGTGYTDFPVAPPEGVPVAAGTTTSCGRWYVTGTTKPLTECSIVCVEQSIDITLFLAANPSLGKIPGGCSRRLLMSTAYCSGPTRNWDSNTNTTSTTT
jgi:hypothetical protein